jgi:hypothetical protein
MRHWSAFEENIMNVIYNATINKVRKQDEAFKPSDEYVRLTAEPSGS